MASTKSKSRKGMDASQNEATANATSASSVATQTTGRNMADNNSGLPSVFEFEEDIGNAEAPPPLPVGDYPAEVRAAVAKLGKDSGEPYASVQFFIAPESYPADFTEGEPDGMLLTYNRVSLKGTPTAKFRLRRFLEAIGAPTGKKIDLNEWLGRTATVTIQHGEFDGVKRAEIAKVNAA